MRKELKISDFVLQRVLNNKRNPKDGKLGLNYEDSIKSTMKLEFAFAKFNLFKANNSIAHEMLLNSKTLFIEVVKSTLLINVSQILSDGK